MGLARQARAYPVPTRRGRTPRARPRQPAWAFVIPARRERQALASRVPRDFTRTRRAANCVKHALHFPSPQSTAMRARATPAIFMQVVPAFLLKIPARRAPPGRFRASVRACTRARCVSPTRFRRTWPRPRQRRVHRARRRILQRLLVMSIPKAPKAPTTKANARTRARLARQGATATAQRARLASTKPARGVLRAWIVRAPPSPPPTPRGVYAMRGMAFWASAKRRACATS